MHPKESRILLCKDQAYVQSSAEPLGMVSSPLSCYFPGPRLRDFIPHELTPLVAQTCSSWDRSRRRAITWWATSPHLALPILKCNGATLSYPCGVHASNLDKSTKRRGGSLQGCCCVYCTPTKRPRLCLLVYTTANIPLSCQHLLKPTPNGGFGLIISSALFNLLEDLISRNEQLAIEKCLSQLYIHIFISFLPHFINVFILIDKI